jgi:lipoprotein-anchoring transpeptidase ErfK/SrfK
MRAPAAHENNSNQLPEWMAAALREMDGCQCAGSACGTGILVNIGEQKIYLLRESRIVSEFPVSSSRYGTGNREGSHQTPLGLHRIEEKIGIVCQQGEIISRRVPTGRIAADMADNSGNDVITSRILWLKGLEPGKNSGPGIDSYQRYIYIHGTAQEHLIGSPASIGCIRMKNDDVIALFQAVEVGTLVNIVA